jgi:hypothetical protein
MALFTVKMDMEVVILAIVVATAEFVADAVAGVVQDMDQAGFPESLQGPENIGLVDGFEGGFEFRHGQGTVRCGEGPGDDDAVRRRFHAVVLEEFNEAFFHH